MPRSRQVSPGTDRRQRRAPRGMQPGGRRAPGRSRPSGGMEVRGVMGYEEHIVGLADREARTEQLGVSMELLMAWPTDWWW